MYRKHRERQAAAAGGPNGRAHSSDSLQEEDYGDYSFSDYQAAGPSLPEGGEEEDMEQENSILYMRTGNRIMETG